MTLPKISCLTITQNRLRLLKEAITCFCTQTYPNKELIIVSTGNSHYNQWIQYYLNTLAHPQILLIQPTLPVLSLAQLRNLSIEAASGDFLCQWDDDDLSHPERLTYQMQALKNQNASACLMTDNLHYFTSNQTLYWADWETHSPDLYDQLIPGSILWEASALRYSEEGPYTHKGEDSSFLAQHILAGKLAKLRHFGFMMVYRHHGQNTFDHAHHQKAATQLQAHDQFVLEKELELRAAISHYPIARPVFLQFRHRSPWLLN